MVCFFFNHTSLVKTLGSHKTTILSRVPESMTFDDNLEIFSNINLHHDLFFSNHTSLVMTLGSHKTTIFLGFQNQCRKMLPTGRDVTAKIDVGERQFCCKYGQICWLYALTNCPHKLCHFPNQFRQIVVISVHINLRPRCQAKLSNTCTCKWQLVSIITILLPICDFGESCVENIVCYARLILH